MRVLHTCLAAFYIDNFGYQENILPKMHKLQGHVVAILASTENYVENAKLGYVKPQVYINNDGIPVTRLPYVGWLPHKIATKLRIYTGVQKFLNEFRPDIIFLHDVQSLANIYIRKYAQQNSHVKIYADGHADFTNSARTWVSKYILHKVIYKYYCSIIEPYVLKFYGTLPCRVSFFKEVYNVNPKKIELLVMGVDDEILHHIDQNKARKEVREKHGINEDDFILITGGKINKLKNIHLLIEAVANISTPKIKLLYFGEMDAEMEEYCRPFLNNQSIISAGWLDANTIYHYLYAADLVCFPGKHSVIWEQAVGMGLPCIFKRIEGHEHVDLGGNCILLDDVSPNALKETIFRIFSDKELYTHLKRTAETKGISAFSYYQIAKKAIEC